MLKSCGPIDGKIRDLGSSYYLGGDLEKALFGWLITQNYHLNPRKFERPHRSSNRDDSGTRKFLWDGELKAVLEEQFELVLSNPKLTETIQPLMETDFSSLRIIPQKEAEQQAAMRAQMKQEARELKQGVPA